MRFKFHIFIIIMLIVSNAFSQVTEEWVRKYPGPLDKGANGIKVLTKNNNIYVFGDCSIFIGANFMDLALLKYNSAGNEVWSRVYNNPQDWVDIASGMTIDNSENIIITGRTNYLNNAFFNIVNYSSAGNQNWVTQYNSTPPSNLYNNPVAIHSDNSGNVYIAALSSFEQQVSDYLTVKYNSSGALQWAARFNGGADYPFDMKVDNNGNAYVTGHSTSDSTGYDIKTVKYDSQGNFQWVRKFQAFLSSPTFNVWCRMEIDNEENVYVAGTCYGPFGNWDLVLIKYLPDGTQSWVKYYGTSANDRFHAITIDMHNNVYTTGFINTNAEAKCLILRYNSSGDLTKEIIYDGPGDDDYPWDIKTDLNENIYVTGSVSPTGSSNSDIFTLKYDSSGTQEWVKFYNGAGDGKDVAYSLALDNNNNVYVAGVTADTAYGVMTTIKYAQSTGIQTISNELPGNFSLSQNYPNPFNPSTNIKFEIPKASHVKIVIHDALGREVSILANERMNAGSYSASFDGANLNSGIYFYTLIADGFKETKKMILLK